MMIVILKFAFQLMMNYVCTGQVLSLHALLWHHR